jgi:acetyl/propionyl-CoA carboxylase alpha subunit
MYQAKVQDYTFDISNEQLTTSIEFQSEGSKAYSAVIDGKQVQVDLVKIDEELNQVVLRMAGKKYTVQLKGSVEIMLEKLGMKVPKRKTVNQLIAPMPGLILKVLVTEGQEVKQGESLLVLEAMKMENVFKATKDSIVKQIKVSEKQSVEKGEELITFI